MLENGINYLIGNITGNADTLNIRGKAGISDNSQIIINARVGISPDELSKLVRNTLDDIAQNKISINVDAWKCLSPGYPNPTYRYNRII